MRISDWSSDVCSSDLRGQMRNAAPAHRLQIGDKTARRRQVRPAEAPEAVERRNAEKLLQPRFGPDAVEIASTPAGGIHRRAVPILRRHQLGRAAAGKLGQIGRATCRERVWQYV